MKPFFNLIDFFMQTWKARAAPECALELNDQILYDIGIERWMISRGVRHQRDYR